MSGNAARRRVSWSAVLAGVVSLVVLRHASLSWGASSREVDCVLPGDALLSRTDLSATRAITIGARSGDVWPWIAQLGAGRGGFYSYDFLENLLGCHIHSVDRIVEEWQSIAVGDQIHLAPEVALTVVQMEPERSLVLRGGLPGTAVRSSPYDFTWAFVLGAAPDGDTRLVVRERYAYARPWVAAVVEPVELVSFVMSRRMMQGIRRRSERVPRG